MTAAAAFFLTLILVQTPLFATAGAAPQTATTIPNFEERNRGIELYRQEKFAEASSVLRKAVKKNRTDDEAWYYLGLTLIHQKKDLKDASKAFQTALQLRANFAAAHAGLGYALLLRNKPSDAIREARAALSISTNLPNAYYIVGVVSLRAGATEEALQNAEAAITVDSQFASAYLLKSQALVSFLATPPVSKIIEGREIVLSRYRGAADALEKYIQMNPREKDVWADQLEALRFYVLTQTRKDLDPGLVDSSEVTTKVRILSKPEPRYTETARQNQVVGTVVLRAVFAADGTVKHILVLKALPDGLTQRAVDASRLIKFVPAAHNGQSVSMFLQLEYNFNLY